MFESWKWDIGAGVVCVCRRGCAGRVVDRGRGFGLFSGGSGEFVSRERLS